MSRYISIYFLVLCSLACSKKAGPSNMVTSAPPSPTETRQPYYYLALGDSYTIGESVLPAENFPNQAATLFNSASSQLIPRIIARTGWTTDELENGIRDAAVLQPLRSSYDFVTLLIGVNNQYRGRSVASYRPEFEALLQKAIQFAGNRVNRVTVLSIPDWGVTPFAAGRDRQQIAREIDAYNDAAKQLCVQYQVPYINITDWTREAATDPTLLAPDGLHPSAREYQRWAGLLSSRMRAAL